MVLGRQREALQAGALGALEVEMDLEALEGMVPLVGLVVAVVVLLLVGLAALVAVLVVVPLALRQDVETVMVVRVVLVERVGQPSVHHLRTM